MGSEQSSSKRESREYREPAATPRDVQNALDQQRRLYEQKMQQMLEEAKRAATTTTPPVSQVNSPHVTAFHQQQTATELLERQRTPYSYNQTDLKSPVTSGSLYPTLTGAGCSNPPQANVAFPANSYGSGYGNAVYTNSSYQYQQQPLPQPVQRNLLHQPSAPPCETLSKNPRARSQSRQRCADNDVNCLTCGKMYGERIYQCNHGHSSCDLCKMRQVPCGCCRQQITDRRNYDLEKYLIDKRVRCPNSTDGCRLFIKMADIAIHEKECPFKMLECPSLGSCSWKGKLSQLSDHFNEMHPMHNQGELDKEMFMSNFNSTSTSHVMHYIKIGTFNFLFHIKVSESDARVYMAVQLIGTKHSAAKWEYEIHIYNKSQPRRKYQYIDRCSSTSEPLQEIVSSTKCAVIPLDYVKTFVCGGAIAYKFFIKRDDFKTNEPVTRTEEVRRGPQPRRNFKKFVKKN